MKRFSKLKKQIENLFEPDLNMEFCCNSYPMRSRTGYAHNSIPRFYIKLGKEIIWDYPKNKSAKKEEYGYWASNNGISALVRNYIDTPVEELLNKDFKSDLTDLFKAADRRLGKGNLVRWAILLSNPVVCKILIERYELKPSISLSFREHAILGMYILSKQPPMTLEQMREQSMRVNKNLGC
jgi:hypothetical protein